MHFLKFKYGWGSYQQPEVEVYFEPWTQVVLLGKLFEDIPWTYQIPRNASGTKYEWNIWRLLTMFNLMDIKDYSQLIFCLDRQEKYEYYIGTCK